MKAWHITAYTFAADVYCPSHIEEWATTQLRAEGVLPHEIESTAQAGASPDVGVLAHRSEGLLYRLAAQRGLNYNDSKTYDSGDFPKPIFASDDEESHCGAEHAPRYVVVENTPGYLPEDDDPFTTDDYSEAVAYLNERAAEYENDPDGDYKVTYGLASSANLAAVSVEDLTRTHDLGRWISIELDEA